MEGAATGPLAAVGRAALAAATPAWRIGLAIDRRRKLARRRTLGRPAVSIGNLTVGGTGKTPAVIWAVERLEAAGHRPAVLTRGHGGTHTGPADEVLELREALGPATPVQPDPDRHAGAAAVLAVAPGVSCFVLDDGFQRRDVERDLDLVLVDASRSLAAARLLPRGLLREPPSALGRADAVVLTRVERAGAAKAAAAAGWVERWHGRPPLAGFAHRWAAVDRHPGGTGPPACLAGRRVFAAAGVGHPDAFARQLQAAGAAVAGTAPLDDHQRLDARGLADLHAAARACGASSVATTQKDWVKWRTLPRPEDPLPVWVPRLRLEPVNGGEALEALLLQRVGPPPR